MNEQKEDGVTLGDLQKGDDSTFLVMVILC